MSTHAELIDRFYTAFAARDHEAMAACYHPDVVFDDPVFRDLRGAQASDMWQMLCVRGKDLQIRHSDVQVEGDSGSAVWDADYTFSLTGRKVHNHIEARFRFKDGLIVEHRDTFSLYRWMRMGLGPVGTLLGWLPPVQSAFRRKARAGLDAFVLKRDS